MQKIFFIDILISFIVFATTEVTHKKTSIKQLEMDDLIGYIAKNIRMCSFYIKRRCSFYDAQIHINK